MVADVVNKSTVFYGRRRYSILKIVVYWDVSPCSLVDIGRRFRKFVSFIIILIMEAVSSSETLKIFYQTARFIISGDSQPSSYSSPWQPQLSKSKVKQSLYTPWRRLGGEEYSSYSFTTSALDGGEWSTSRPGRALPPGKGPQVPIVQEAGWTPEPVWTQRIEEKSFDPAGDRTPIARSSST
jgi:hypothetical protein